MTLSEAARKIFRERIEWTLNFGGKIVEVQPISRIIGPYCRVFSPELHMEMHEKLIKEFEKSGRVSRKDGRLEPRTDMLLRLLINVFLVNIMRDRTSREVFIKALKIRSYEEFQESSVPDALERPYNVLLFYMVLLLIMDKAWGITLELRLDEEEEQKKSLLVRTFKEWYGVGKRDRDTIHLIIENLLKEYVKSYYYDGDFEEADFAPAVDRDGKVIILPMVNYAIDGIYAIGCEKLGDLEIFLSEDIVNHFKLIIVED